MDKSQLKVLIVNDKMDLRNIIRDYLKDDGYTNLSVSENGLSALRKAAAEPPDLIIADRNIPGLTGLELLKEIRRDKTLAEVPFIMISPESEQKYVAQAAEYGVNAYVVKPFSRQTLAEKVNHLLERRLNPLQGDLLYQEANLLAQNEHLEDALEKYLQALETTQNSLAAIHYKIGRIHEKTEADDQAEGEYQAAVDLSRQYVDAYDALGALYLKKSQPERALMYFRQSSEISPLNAGRQLAYGETLLAAGEFQAAEKAFKLALKLDPAQMHVFNRLGISLRRQGKLKEALQYLLQAAETVTEDENLYYNLSRVYLDRGDRESARLYLEKSLEINPDFSEAREMIAEIEAPS
ncbi:MAG: response regulator [Pseudomonadota bacterium]